MEKNATLEYKQHNPVFQTLDDNLQHIASMSIHARNSYGSVKNYYQTLNSLYMLNSAYLYRKNFIKSLLRRIQGLLDDKNYILQLKQLTNKQELRKYEQNIINKLDDIFEEMCNDFVEHDLRPKPVMTNKKQSERARDEDEKQELRDLEEIGAI